MEIRYLILILFVLVFASSVYAISINEIMYNPSDELGGTYNEWIELYNPTNESINLTGWKIADPSNHTIEILTSAMIGPNGYFIFSKKPENLSRYYNIICPVAKVGFSLSNDGEGISLKNNLGNIIDNVSYSSSLGGNNNGKTLEVYNKDWYESLVGGGTPCFENSRYNTCDVGIDLVLDKVIFNTGEKVQFTPKAERGGNNTVEYWVEDINTNEIVKSKYKTNNSNQKQWTPSYDGTFIIKANLTYSDCNDTNLENNYIEKLIVIKGVQITEDNNNCDWKIKLFSDYTFENSEDVNWKVKVEKSYGDKANISVRGYVKEYFDDWKMDYKPWTNESVLNYRNQEYGPNLHEGIIYEIFYNITEINCNDTNLDDNFVSKLIYVGEELPIGCEECVKCKECKPCKTTKTECPLIMQSSNEKDIKDKVQENISYISKEVKERRYAVYFFCLLLICMLINYIIKKNG